MFWNRGASAEKDGADDDLFNFSPSAFKEEAKDERLSFTSVEDATNPIEGEGIDNRALLGADSFSNMGGDYEDVYAQYDRALRLFKKRQKRCCICCGVTTVLATASIPQSNFKLPKSKKAKKGSEGSGGRSMCVVTIAVAK